MDRYPDAEERAAHPSGLSAAERWLIYPNRAVLILGAVLQLASGLGVVDEALVADSTSIVFLLLIARLGVAAGAQRDRRPALFVLMLGVLLWAVGSASVYDAAPQANHEFPAPGEWMFLLAYVGMAAYLMIDVDRKQRRPAKSWLDVVIICGGASCFASLVLVAPIRLSSGATGLPLLLALLYPLLDLSLAMVVLGQMVRRARGEARTNVYLGIAFVLFALADSAFALQSSAQSYDFGPITVAMWGGGFALLTAAACRPRGPVIKVLPRVAGTRVMLTAGFAAIIALALRPDATLSLYTTPPAVLTLVAAAVRMALALRDANRAAEAVTLSLTDDLTKLPNRRAVRGRLSALLAEQKPMALMLLDLDGFKEINDALGHHAGDMVLQFAAVRMQEAVASGVMVARLGGDEFAIVVESRDEVALLELARTVLAEITKPIVVDGIEICPSGSVGIAVSLDTDAQDGDILRRADVAMYQAKAAHSGAALYDAHVDEFSRPRLQLAEELRKGITDGQIEVWYQPQVEAGQLRVDGVEALVRWRHPTQGLVSPVAFLPAARRSGMMGALSEVIAVQAVRDLSRWLGDGLDLRVAINCAPPELLSQTFLPRLYGALAASNVPADRLVLEVTEDSFLSDPHRARNILLDLRSHGVQVSIDDYGTGFSSLAYLRDLPVQELKIDRSFVHGVCDDPRSQSIIASTIQLAHALDMRTVAEGVEDAEAMAALREMGIDTLQGYHVARPMPADELEQWVRDWRTTAELLAGDNPPPEPEREASRNAARSTRVLGNHRSHQPRKVL